MNYRGRFAPSPTGPLHFGSLVTAVASYLEARARGGEWLVRIEDVDRPRTVEGSAELILGTLDTYGFRWDGEVVWQSRREAEYRAALELLQTRGAVYPCGCSRKEVGGGIYPGTCRSGLPAGKEPRAWRLRVPAEEIVFVDRIHGRYSQNLGREVGDFVLFRADGLFAYQLAVVVDDAWQGITHVVRGEDMLDSTPRQIFLQRTLGFSTPEYLHVPLVLSPDGQKLSKQTGAAPLPMDDPARTLAEALIFLGQVPPSGIGLRELWEWAIGNWNPGRHKG